MCSDALSTYEESIFDLYRESQDPWGRVDFMAVALNESCTVLHRECRCKDKARKRLHAEAREPNTKFKHLQQNLQSSATERAPFGGGERIAQSGDCPTQRMHSLRS